MLRVDKKSPPALRHHHCFPSIDKPLDQTGSQQSEACLSFRPLYQCPAKDPRGAGCDSDNAQGAEGDGNIEEVREKSYLKGMEAGKAEACEIVQKELEVPVSQFLNEHDAFDHCLSRITDSYSRSIVALAVGIAKKIAGDPIRFDMEGLEPISRLVHSFMQRSYQLSIKFNREEINAITELLGCLNPGWRPSDTVRLTGDPQLQAGQLHVEPCVEASEHSNEDFDRQVEDILSAT